MILAKPVLVSHAKPLARIVRECSCGFVFQSGNPPDAAEKIVEAYQKRLDAEIGERGRRAAVSRYTWEIASLNLLTVYRRLESQRCSKRP
jgi:glycosyltransferase involved in cell wall biosynthesis